MKNQKRGKTFEERCAARAQELNLDLHIKRIVRTDRFMSCADLEFYDFPHFRVDCKFTINEFNWNDLGKFYKSTKKKYCKSSDELPIVIFGEQKGKKRLNFSDVSVLLRTSYGLTVVQYDSFLNYLNRRIKNGR